MENVGDLVSTLSYIDAMHRYLLSVDQEERLQKIFEAEIRQFAIFKQDFKNLLKQSGNNLVAIALSSKFQKVKD